MPGPPQRLRVLEATQRFPPAVGGVERHVAQLTRELRARGVQVEVATTDLQRDEPFARLPPGEAPLEAGVRRHRALPWGVAPHGLGIAAPGQLADLLRTECDVVHAHAFGYAPTWFGRLASALREIPLVVTPHVDEGSGSSLSRAYARLVARGTLVGAARVIALTRLEAAYLERLGVPRDRLRVLPNGIDLEEFRGVAPSPPHPGLRLLFVGRVYPRQKGLDTLVDALARLPPSLGAELRVVGEDWGARAGLEARARRLGVLDRITFTGRVPRAELLTEYGRSDLVVVPSRFEPFGIVLLEAMAAGRPVVASRTGGIPEVVEEDRTARLVSPGDPVELSEALTALGEDPGRARALGEAGRERVVRFSWPVLAPRFVELFQELAPERG